MLFNSYAFIFIFLPIVLLGFFYFGKQKHSRAMLWLAAASLFFYGWWDVRYVGLLLGSIAFNYLAARFIAHRIMGQSKILLVSAVTVNLMMLGYFKYANFFVDNLNYLAGVTLTLKKVILPLGISFFTFTQIAFLVDAYQGKVKEYNFIHYTLFVTYFPHLIAGPVLHHKEMMPQFAKRDVCYINWDNVAIGLAIFVLGLAKKLMLADSFGEFATPIFNAVATGGHPMLFEAWIGALSYTLQLYFDFSGYSDMAIGLSLMFNVHLPLNFNSPYRATNIIEFWRRWHMTLSRFLRDYLYIPLGGSRNGKFQRYFNLMVTMLLGGLWHGAGWTFIIWGGLHGFYLMVNHAWRSIKQHMSLGDGGWLGNLASGFLTFVAVVVAWVFFRADSFSSALTMLEGMAGINGGVLPSSLEGKFERYFVQYGWVILDKLMPLSLQHTMDVVAILIFGLFVVWGLPNVRQLYLYYTYNSENIWKYEQLPEDATLLTSRLFHFIKWRPSTLQGVFYGALFLLLIIHMGSASDSEFLYFQF